MIRDSYYASAFSKLQELQAAGLPFVLICPLVEEDEEENVYTQLQVFAGTNSNYEGEGLIAAAMREVEQGTIINMIASTIPDEDDE